jgi:hypothetical protein
MDLAVRRLLIFGLLSHRLLDRRKMPAAQMTRDAAEPNDEANDEPP